MGDSVAGMLLRVKKSRDRDAGSGRHMEGCPPSHAADFIIIAIYYNPGSCLKNTIRLNRIIQPFLLPDLYFSFYEKTLHYNITCFVIRILNGLNNMQPPA